MLGCTAVNIFFERNLIVVPGVGCDNPPRCASEKGTLIVLVSCQLWEVLPWSNVSSGVHRSHPHILFNTGYTSDQFQIVVAGSNGYVKKTVEVAVGYTAPQFPGTNAINAPADCNGANSYLEDLYWTDGTPFDAARGSAACSAYSNASTGANCQFFNSYILSKNNIPQGQYKCVKDQ